MKCPYCGNTLTVVSTPADREGKGCGIVDEKTATIMKCIPCDIVAGDDWWKDVAKNTRGLPKGDR